MDTLDPQEMSQGLAQENPDNSPDEAPDELSPHQMEAVNKTGAVENDLPDQLSPDDLAHHAALAKLNGTLEGDVPVDDKPGFTSGLNTMQAAGAFYKTHDSMFRKILYTMNVPEQFLARQMVGVMAGMGAIGSTDAKNLLSQDELAPSSVIDYYWKAPESFAGRAGRLGVDLLADIVLDPLNLVGVGEVDDVAKLAIAGKKITGLEKMSTAQKSVYRTMSAIEKVVTADGQVLHLDDALKAESTVQANLKLLGDSRDAFQQGNPLGFAGLGQSLNLSEDGQKAAQAALVEGLSRKSLAQSLVDGEKELTLGPRIPFSNMAWEVKVPGPMSEVLGKGLQAAGNPALGAAAGAVMAGPMGAVVGAGAGAAFNAATGPLAQPIADAAEALSKNRAIQALDNTFNLGGMWAGAQGVSQEMYRRWQNIWTKTGNVFFDSGLEQANNVKASTAEILRKQTSGWNEGLQAVKDRVGETAFKGLMTDFLGEAESGIHTPEEAQALATKFGKVNEAGQPALSEWQPLTQYGSPELADRAQRVAAHPELTNILGTMREQLKSMVGRYDERNIPFEELNPFGEGWMTRYVKHQWTNDFREYLSKGSEAQDSFMNAMKGSEDLTGTFDQSAIGRQYRGSILDANEESMSKYGIKMFVDDPVELFNTRIQEMQNAVAKHDLIKSAMPGSIRGLNPGFGWMKADPADFGHMDATVEVGINKFKPLSFVPEDLANSFRTGENVYFPTDVYDRMLWNTQKDVAGSFNNTLAAMDSYTWFWRNGILANTGYVGTKFFHNMLSYFGLMQNADPRPIFKAMRAVMLPDAVENVLSKGVDMLENIPGVGEKLAAQAPAVTAWKQLDGSVVNLNHEGLLDLAIKHGVLNQGSEVQFDDVLDHLSSASKSQVGSPKNWINYAYMFGAYRSAAQYGDEIPKLATFISRLEQGFTAESAAESATRYFYNFNPVTAEQQLAKSVIPFISFPMKTAELVAAQVKDGELLQLAIPGKVQQILSGRYVEDRDTRDYLTSVLPGAKNWYEPISGGVTPGMRSMQIELPWCYNTLSAMWNEDSRLHPIFQILTGLMAVKHDGNELDGVTDNPTFSKIIGQNLDMVLPQPVRVGMTLAAINGSSFPGSDYLIQRYQTNPPDPHQLATGKQMGVLRGTISEDNPTGEPSDLDIQKSAMNTKFSDAVDFGRWMDKSYGSSWLYNMMFHGSLDADKPGIYSDEQSAVRGEYIRQHIHDMSLGLVTMDRMDKTMFSKYFAIDREAKTAKAQMLDEANKAYNLVDPKKALSPEALQARAEQMGDPLAKKVIALTDQKHAIIAYYDFMLGAQKNVPNFSLPRLLFGVDSLNLDMSGKPGPLVHQDLFPKNRQISDDDASRVMNNAIIKKWFPSRN